MNQPAPAPLFSPTTTISPRARRGDAAVLAQYIQDITHADLVPAPQRAAAA